MLHACIECRNSGLVSISRLMRLCILSLLSHPNKALGLFALYCCDFCRMDRTLPLEPKHDLSILDFKFKIPIF